MSRVSDYVVDFPTLGFLITDWAQAHCVIPDGEQAGEPYELADWQLWCFVNHYRVKPTAELGQLGPAFHYRRSQWVMPQKAGKGPLSACQVCVEGVGPALFAGWATGGETYDCRDHGCGCGFVYEYEPGEPMGRPWPTPLIQVTAVSEEQADNIYGALRPMIELGPLSNLIPKTGEEFIRLPDGGRIDRVTSSAQSRLGQRVTFVPQDETGIWTAQNKMVKVADTQNRGLAGMGGRSVETTNGWDPSENSVAQQTAQIAAQVEDIFRFHKLAPANLSYRNKDERRRIHRIVYEGSWWVDLDSIEGMAVELLQKDPAQAERFFGNRIVAGLGAWVTAEQWASWLKPREVEDDTKICLGFDGSDSNDWTVFRAETIDGYRFTPTYGPDQRPAMWDPVLWGGSIPRGEVDAARAEIFTRYNVQRAYCDPRDWQSEIGAWALEHGQDVVVEWATYRVSHMHDALERSLTDYRSGRSFHDSCPITAEHVQNARKLAKPGDRYILGKPADHQKIDAAMGDTLAHEAAADAHLDGWGRSKSGLTRVTGRTTAQ